MKTSSDLYKLCEYTEFGGFRISTAYERDPRCRYIVLETRPGASFDETDWVDYTECLTQLYSRCEKEGSRVSIVFDIKMHELGVDDIHRMGKLMHSLKHRTEKVLMSSSIILQNAILEQLLTMFFEKFYRLIRPQIFTKDVASSVRFFRQVADREGAMFSRTLGIVAAATVRMTGIV